MVNGLLSVALCDSSNGVLLANSHEEQIADKQIRHANLGDCRRETAGAAATDSHHQQQTEKQRPTYPHPHFFRLRLQKYEKKP
jgi:hypothetical protein